jgi:hypothetical protein
MPVDAVRSLVPGALEVERHEGRAWITLIPFLIAESRPAWLPRVLASAFLETNLRAYARGPDGEHGIYFFSLEAESLPAVATARLFYGLPYFFAAMSRRVDGGCIVYASRRRQGRRADLEVTWTIGEPTGVAVPGTLDQLVRQGHQNLVAYRASSLEWFWAFL